MGKSRTLFESDPGVLAVVIERAFLLKRVEGSELKETDMETSESNKASDKKSNVERFMVLMVSRFR